MQWSDNGVASANKFLQKIWNLNQSIINKSEKIKKTDAMITKEFSDKVDTYILKIGDLINKFQFNVVIASFYEIYRIFNFYFEKEIKKETFIKNLEKMMLSLVPFIPHLASECLQNLSTSNLNQWPKIDKKLIVNLKTKLVIQINGKTREVIEIDKDLEEKEVINMVTKKEKIEKFLKEKNIIKHIYVKNRLINFVIK